VTIFWRRALFEKGEKVYCLVNADMLSYDVSEAAAHRLEEFMQDIYHEKGTL